MYDVTGIYELFESLFISVKVSNSLNLILGAIYQHSSLGINIKNYIGSFGVNLLENLPTKNIILTGDFNIDLHGDISNLGKLFLDLMSQYGFHNLITISTRVSNQYQSLLDQMWINFKSDFRPFVFQCAISDHFPVGMIFPVRCNYCQANYHLSLF